MLQLTIDAVLIISVLIISSFSILTFFEHYSMPVLLGSVSLCHLISV